MDAERRRQLEQRRRDLAEKLDRRERLEGILERTAVLDAAGVQYGLLFDDSAAVDWVWRHFPRAGGLFSPRIDWPAVPVRDRGPDADAAPAEAAEWIERLVMEHSLDDHEVLIISGNGRDPGIRVHLRQVRDQPAVVSVALETWVVCEPGGWVIEYLAFHGGWAWGKSNRSHGAP